MKVGSNSLFLRGISPLPARPGHPSPTHGPGSPPAAPLRGGLRARPAVTVLFLSAGEGELAAEVGLRDGPVPPSGQGGCQQEQPEEEHWAGGARGCGGAGAGGAAPRPGRLSAPPGEQAALSLLWQRRIAG